MHLSFIGAGYVGLVSGTLLAELGHTITCIDKDESKIAALRECVIPIYEPGLTEYVERLTKAGRLSFSLKQTQECNAVFIAVGTPPLDSGAADLSYVYSAALEVAENCKDVLIVIKSTVPPSTCANLQAFLREKGYNNEIVSNPEFLREGSAIEDFLKPDRIVVGTQSQKAREMMAEIYKPLTQQGYKIIYTDVTTSELIKYSSNAFLATKIGFINEMADLCESVGASVETLSDAMGADHRIGSAFLKVGPGFGGSCFPKDILALSYLASSKGVPSKIINSVIDSNKERKVNMATKVMHKLGDIKGKKICSLGITFKAGTDDVRSSPAVEICEILCRAGADVNIYDPKGSTNAKQLLPDATFHSSIFDAAKNASAIVILTEWDEFKSMNLNALSSIVKEKTIFDFRNILNPSEVKSHGFEYLGIGRRG
ncbi:MAG: UDP-glucose/GDP-mannose dehydrogenase family protein [Rickettsiaceae bacterium]|nr:UDP-glucose/GDP-mannose dehydrogenase family protein [Rickettsiaceae bacterium]